MASRFTQEEIEELLEWVAREKEKKEMEEVEWYTGKCLPLSYEELLHMDGQAVYTWYGKCYIVNAEGRYAVDKYRGFKSLESLAGHVMARKTMWAKE